MIKQMDPARIIINDNYSISVEQLCIPSHYKDDLENVLIPYGLILDRIEALANEIFNELSSGNEPLICLCVLKGGYRFCADLTRKIQDKNRTDGEGRCLPIKISFISFDDFRNKTGVFQCEHELVNDIFQKNVLVIENCVHGGKKVMKIMEYLKTCLPRNIKCCSLLLKRSMKDNLYTPDYVGFSIPEKFVVGYALDFNEHFRDLEHLCLIKESSRHKYTNKET